MAVRTTGSARLQVDDAPIARVDAVEFEFVGALIHWRGPAPFHFVAMPPDQARALRAVARSVTYGWGVIPVRVRIGASEWGTSLFPRDGGYLVPIKDAIRRAEGLALGDDVVVRLTVEPRNR